MLWLVCSSLAFTPPPCSFFASCVKGLEPVLAAELRSPRVGAVDVTEGHLGVSFGGSEAVGVRATLWSRDLTPGFERGGGISGGGLAVVGGALYATTGYGELISLDPATGAENWRQRLAAGITAPTVAGNSIYVVSRDSQAWSINPDNGRIRWQLPAGAPDAVLSGGSAPAVTDRLVIFPFGSGELVATLRLSGVRVWGTSVAGGRRGVAYNNLNDITGDPVVVGGTLYAGNQSGRVVAMEAASGERLWTAQDGAYSPILPAGDSIFFVSDRNELIRLDAETGDRIWGTELPLYVQQRERRRQAVFTHFGPILAGGRLVIASGDGLIRFFDPESGAETGQVALRGGAAAHPIVVGGVLYVVSGDGRYGNAAAVQIICKMAAAHGVARVWVRRGGQSLVVAEPSPKCLGAFARRSGATGSSRRPPPRA